MVSAVICMLLRQVWLLCNFQCVYVLFRLISNARYMMFSSLQVFAFEGQNVKFTVNMLLTCILYCEAEPGCLIRTVASTVCSFLSRISHLSLHIFLQRRCSFTSRKVYIYLETFLCFLHLSDWAYVSQTRCILGLFLLLVVLAPHDEYVSCMYLHMTHDTWHMTWHMCKSVDCFACCIIYTIVWLSSGKTWWFRSSMWISSVAGISKILCTSVVASATRTHVRM